MELGDFPPITPVNFVQISFDCPYFTKLEELRKQFDAFAVPDPSGWCGEESFAQVALGWNEEGLALYLKVDEPFHVACHPDYKSGDSFELFIDTRDVKTSGFNTRFCHHFFFLPEPVEGVQAGEVTRFRTEDSHELAEAKEFKVKGDLHPSHYTLEIFTPAHTLHGYDPAQFDRMGMTYRINRPDGAPQHFSVVSDDYAMEQQPSLWSRVNLCQ